MFITKTALSCLTADAHERGVFINFVIEECLRFGIGDRQAEIEEKGSEFRGPRGQPSISRTHCLLFLRAHSLQSGIQTGVSRMIVASRVEPREVTLRLSLLSLW